jgi:hypothetical protein
MKCNLFIWIDRQKWQSFVRPFDHDSFLLLHQSGNGYIRSKCHDFDILKIYWLTKQTTNKQTNKQQTNKQTNKQTKTHTVILFDFITSTCRHRYIFIYLKLNFYIFYLVISFFFLIYLENRSGESFTTIPGFLK